MLFRHLRDVRSRTAVQRNTTVLNKRTRQRAAAFVKRGRRRSYERSSFLPPEDWHEPTGTGGVNFRVVVQSPGPGYRHVLTPAEIRDRLSVLPPHMLQPLEVVQLSRMTNKKRRFPCYGMQWGGTLYLYPAEENLVEYFNGPPKPAQHIEAKMYGGRWLADASGQWKLVWTEDAIKDFYLNNVLLHELGHLLDNRNRSYVNRERFAEWFAIEYGFKSRHRKGLVGHGPNKSVRRRHHSKA
jgi:hypothetical protein